MKRILSLSLLLILMLTLAACRGNNGDSPTSTSNSATSLSSNHVETTPTELSTEPTIESTSAAAPTPSTETASPEEPSSGLLVAAGTGYIHTFDLESDSTWQRRMSYSDPWSTVALIEEERELLIANTSGAEPVIVTSYDVDTLSQKYTTISKPFLPIASSI